MHFRTAVFALVTVLAGCQRPATHVLTAAAPSLGGSWTQGSDPEDGITIGIPAGWRQGVDKLLDPMGMAQDAGAGSQPAGAADPNNPMAQLEANMASQSKKDEEAELARLRADGTVLQVIDSSRPTPGEARTRYYVKKIDHDSNYSFDAAVDDEKEHLQGLGASAPKIVQLPIGKAARFDADSKTRGGDEVTRISYVVVDGKTAYVLRFISTNNPQAITSIADAVAQTLRIKPGK